jgi:hypothetical protein
MMRSRDVLFACALFQAACGAGEARLESGVYRDGAVAFRIGEVPPGWRAVHVDRATLAYRDESQLASILLDGRCYRKDDDVPLVALTDHLMMGTTERAIDSQETISFDGREAMHTRMRAKLDGVPMDYDVYVTKKDGCIYDFVYVAEPTGKDASNAGIPAFERFVSSFHALGVPSP